MASAPSTVSQNRVCAVIVTFRPRPCDLEHVSLVRPQVQDLVVVDNGSEEEQLVRLRAMSRALGFNLLENGRNLGIAAALNAGVRWAKERGCAWIALFDQDSAVTDGFIARMLADYAHFASQRKILLLVPRHRDPQTNAERTYPMHEDGGPFVTITSGSLLPANAFDIAGYFKEELFIYTVDDEYSLRIRSIGYSIALSREAVLLHNSGLPTYYSLFGKRLFQTTNYGPGVRYYVSRNRIWMTGRYGSSYPRYVRGALRASLIDLCKLTIAEEDRWSKLGMIMRGVLDGMRGRMGETVTL